MHQVTPQITLNASGQKSPHFCFTCITESQDSFAPSLFGVTGYFETGAPNVPKMTLDTSKR